MPPEYAKFIFLVGLGFLLVALVNLFHKKMKAFIWLTVVGILVLVVSESKTFDDAAVQNFLHGYTHRVAEASNQ